MNCLDFRRQVFASPSDLTPDARLHEQGCTQCADLAQRLRRMDARIVEAAGIRIPDGLVERVLSGRSAPIYSRRGFLAAATASFALAVGAGSLAYLTQRDDPLALAGIAFVVEEEANAILHAKPSDRSALMKTARQMNVTLPEQLGELRYVGTCPFQGTIAHHVIVTTPQGKATLLLLPEIALQSPGSASARGLQARVMPVAVGSVAMISMSSRGLDRIGRYISSV